VIGVGAGSICALCGSLCLPYEEVRQKITQLADRRSGLGWRDLKLALRYPFQEPVTLSITAVIYGACHVLLPYLAAPGYGYLLAGMGLLPTLAANAVMFGFMTSAIDHIAADPERSTGHPHLAYLQIAEATNTVAILSRHSSLRLRFPVRELVMITGLALLFLSLYLLRGTGTGLPGSGNSAVPAFVSAKDRLQQQSVPNTPEPAPQDPPTVAEVQARADESASAEQDLLTLADAPRMKHRHLRIVRHQQATVFNEEWALLGEERLEHAQIEHGRIDFDLAEVRIHRRRQRRRGAEAHAEIHAGRDVLI
jgi:hypothetical protein